MPGLRSAVAILCVLAAFLWAAAGRPAGAAEGADGAVVRGAYLFTAAGCAGCHTDIAGGGPPLAGGRALKTPFGTFYGPNITPDPDHGIGRWSFKDFRRAMRLGRAPDGSHYFPVFPYPSFTGMTDADLADLWAYMRRLAPVARPNRPHDVAFPFSWRLPMAGWKWMFFQPGPFVTDPTRSPEWNRGAYLVQAVAHCGECHTPRNRLGALERDRHLAGTASGPDGGPVPNITPDPDTGIGRWSAADLTYLLAIGLLPDGDVVGDVMGGVVDNGTSKLTDADRTAIAEYLRSVDPVRHEVPRGP